MKTFHHIFNRIYTNTEELRWSIWFNDEAMVLDSKGIMVQFLVRARDFSYPKNVHTFTGPTSILVDW